MKNVLLFSCLLAISTQITAQTPLKDATEKVKTAAATPSVNPEEEAIKQVIEGENAAFNAGDTEKARSFFHFQPYNRGMLTLLNGVTLYKAGEEFNNFYKDLKPNNIVATHTNYNIKITGNTAWETNLQTQRDKADNKVLLTSHQMRCLEKINGNWKMVTLSGHDMKPQLSEQTPSVNDDEAIKKVIIDESTAWANRDTTAYFAAYADNELTQGVYNNRNMSIGVYNGFAAIQKSVRDGIKANPNQVYKPTIERSNWLIKVLSPEWAWVNFTQKTTTVRGQVNTSYETRLMKKEGGKWRINVVNAVWDYKNVVNPAVNPDEEDIKTFIVNETEAWLDQKQDVWAEGFIHEPYLTWTVTNGGEPGDALTMRGWDALNAYMDKWFKNDMSALTKEWRKAKTTRDQWQIQIRGNVAYVSFNQHSESEKQKMDSTETRVLERINGKWKIAMQATVADFKDATPPIRSKY
jgi:hypothetical protein